MVQYEYTCEKCGKDFYGKENENMAIEHENLPINPNKLEGYYRETQHPLYKFQGIWGLGPGEESLGIVLSYGRIGFSNNEHVRMYKVYCFKQSEKGDKKYSKFLPGKVPATAAEELSEEEFEAAKKDLIKEVGSIEVYQVHDIDLGGLVRGKIIESEYQKESPLIQLVT